MSFGRAAVATRDVGTIFAVKDCESDKKREDTKHAEYLTNSSTEALVKCL